MKTFKLGEKAPNFELTSTTGETYSLENERNGWQLIVFFRGSWCPVCQKDLKEYSDHLSKFTENNVNVVAISTDTNENLSTFKQEYELKFPVLSDEKHEVFDAYGVFYHGEDAPYEDHGEHGEPGYFILDEEGRVLFQHRQSGPFGRPDAESLRKTIRYIQKNLK
ncbi:peroxiredoxin family protein [Jeotgalibacillus aurantiacus]|uniref:peroxiredoxin family protein n=1 Tax=Jeotgalibacillus aurantiacus TaxID=2763266 RepID=UPI001D0A614F|nr:peroxiredoxin family protein [Jeotgalibacillus aurantiacus]